MSVKHWQIKDTQQFFILTSKESWSTITTVSNSSQANCHCSKVGKIKEDYGLYLSLRKRP
jgi:hypothetical protein